MAEEAAWKVLVRQQQAVEAPGCCDRARGLLAEALGDIATRVLVVDDSRGWRAWAHRAEGMVAEAFGELAAAAYIARAAWILALRGGGTARGPGAAAPLSANDVPDDEGLRAALALLKYAGDRAGRASDHAALSRGHLAGVVRLLDHPHPLPGGVQALVLVKLGEALDDLDRADRFAQESAQLDDEL